MASKHSQRVVSFVALLAWATLGCATEVIRAPVNADAGGDASAADVTSADAAPVDGTMTSDAPSAADTPSAPDATPPPDAPEKPVVVGSCDVLRAGTVSNFMVDGAMREFILTLPPGADMRGATRWPVVFNWHGFGDSARNFNPLLASQVGNSTMPFILVTPVSTRLGPTTMPPGLDWDELRVTPPNREAHLFDAVMRCLDERYGVDRDRVYTVGFSAGGIMSDLLAVLRGDQLAAVATYSGGYLGRMENTDMLGVLRSFVSWPELSTTNRYPQLFLHGGPSDTFSLAITTVYFERFAMGDVRFLRERGHDTIVCNHNNGHRVPAAVTGRQLVEFFAAHRRGMGASPWSAGLPMDYPSYCTFQGRMR